MRRRHIADAPLICWSYLNQKAGKFMKCYIQSEAVRLTGKGWEIRHYLRGVAATAPCHMTLADWLDRRTPVKPALVPATK